MSTPNVQARMLGRALTGLRKNAQLSQVEAAAVVDRSQSLIAQVEGGKLGIRRPDLIVLLQRYGADQDTIDRLVRLREGAGKRGWWSARGLPEWLATYIGLEQDAIAVRAFEVELIPGLLQSREYARKVHLLRGRLPEGAIDARVDARIKRQDRLTDLNDPITLDAVISESALRRCAAEPALGSDQLRLLIERAELPNVTVRVLPFAAGPHPSLQGAFTLLDFPEGLLSTVAMQEYAMGGMVVDDDLVAASLSKLFTGLSEQALDSDRSLSLIIDLLAWIEKGSDCG